MARSLELHDLYLRLWSGENNFKCVKDSVKLYKEVAERIRSNDQGMVFMNSLWDGFMAGWETKVVNSICAPSGTGKTQLAFSLPKTECACVYLNMVLVANDDTNHQKVYRAFRRYMVTFISLLKSDYEQSNSAGLQVYGFTRALLKIIRKHPEMDLPSDLSRLTLVGSSGKDEGEIITRTTSDILKAEISDWSR